MGMYFNITLVVNREQMKINGVVNGRGRVMDQMWHQFLAIFYEIQSYTQATK
jgi:hypothetical protein